VSEELTATAVSRLWDELERMTDPVGITRSQIGLQWADALHGLAVLSDRLKDLGKP